MPTRLIDECEMIACDNIEATAATQVRVRLSPDVIDEYAEDLKNGADMPPIVVFREAGSERNILADGFHRLRAAINVGWEQIGCTVYEGRMQEALQYALGANQEHGLRRTNADKRHAVEMALKDPEISQRSQGEIAEICRVHRRTVIRIQNDIVAPKDKKPDKGVTKSQAATDDDVRDTGRTPTQGDVDLEELRQALKLVKAFPYDGELAASEKLELTKDDVADCEYVSTWLSTLVIVSRSGE